MRFLSTLGFCIALAGCAHPLLKAGGNLGSTIASGVATISSINDSESDTYRTYLYLEPYRVSFQVTSLNDDFVALACRPHSRYLLDERVALDNLNKFQAFLTTNATDPKSPTLASLISDLTSSGTNFVPSDPNKAVEELQAKRDKDAVACDADVRSTFLAPAQSNVLTLATALAAWPKIQSFLVSLLTQADQAKREGKIVDALKDPGTQSSLSDSLAALAKSAQAGGPLASIVKSRKQMALWNAYFEFEWLQNNHPDKAKPELYGQAMEATATMATQLKIYDQLASTSLDDVVSKMGAAIKKMGDAARSGKAPDDSAMADVLSALQFLSDAESNYTGAVSAFHPSSTSKGKPR